MELKRGMVPVNRVWQRRGIHSRIQHRLYFGICVYYLLFITVHSCCLDIKGEISVSGEMLEMKMILFIMASKDGLL